MPSPLAVVKEKFGDKAKLVAELETWLEETGLPFIPEHVDGRVVLRPPAA